MKITIKKHLTNAQKSNPKLYFNPLMKKYLGKTLEATEYDDRGFIRSRNWNWHPTWISKITGKKLAKIQFGNLNPRLGYTLYPNGDLKINCTMLKKREVLRLFKLVAEPLGYELS